MVKPTRQLKSALDDLDHVVGNAFSPSFALRVQHSCDIGRFAPNLPGERSGVPTTFFVAQLDQPLSPELIFIHDRTLTINYLAVINLWVLTAKLPVGNMRRMKKLLAYLNALSPDDRKHLCDRLGTSEAYLRKAVSAGQKFGESLCIKIERESKRAVVCEDLRPDVDWAYIRGTRRKDAA